MQILSFWYGMNLTMKQQQSFFESLLETVCLAESEIVASFSQKLLPSWVRDCLLCWVWDFLPCWVRNCCLDKSEIFCHVDKNLVESDIVYFIELEIAALLSQKLFPCWIRNCCLVESEIFCLVVSETICLFESEILAILSLKLLPSWVRDCCLVEGRNFSEPLFCRTLMNRIVPFLLFCSFHRFLFKGAKWLERVTENKWRRM